MVVRTETKGKNNSICSNFHIYLIVQSFKYNSIFFDLFKSICHHELGIVFFQSSTYICNICMICIRSNFVKHIRKYNGISFVTEIFCCFKSRNTCSDDHYFFILQSGFSGKNIFDCIYIFSGYSGNRSWNDRFRTCCYKYRVRIHFCNFIRSRFHIKF